MPKKLHDRKNDTLQSSSFKVGRERAPFLLALFTILLCGTQVAFANTNMQLQTDNVAPGGITISPSGVNYTGTLGTMNALAIGAAQAGVTASASGTGAVYFTTLNVNFAGLCCGLTGNVKAYVSTQFVGNAASAMTVYACPSSSACNAAAQFSALSTNAGAPTSLATGLTQAQSAATIGLAIYLPDNNGATAFTGAASTVITFSAYVGNFFVQSATLTLGPETVQDAVQLQVTANASGLPVSAGGATDYAIDYGNVNALGIGPGAGLTPVAKAGGIIYSTPYNLLPAFTGMATTTATVLTCVNTNFVHPTILSLYDSTSGSAGSFNAISTNCGSASSITNAAAARSTITRYLGLFVSNANGATAFTGLDTARLTYTITVP